MEPWFLYACATIVCSGLGSFLQKVSAKHNYNSKVVTIFSFVVTVLVAPVVWYIHGAPIEGWQVALFAGGLGGILYAMSYVLRITNLRYIDTTIYFPLYKTLGPLLVLVIGLLYFKDNLTTYDYLGIGIGVLVPLMLLSRSEKHRQQNLTKGLLLLLLTASITALAFATSKIGVDSGVNIWLFMSLQAIVGIVSAMLFAAPKFKKDKLWDFTLHKKAVWIGLLLGLIDTLNIFFILMALTTGLVSVVYTVNSFYILIPIVLSVILYGEHMNIRKAVAIGLSIASVVFFQI
jgi:drug/metabolite transporter (DMT)-like permease